VRWVDHPASKERHILIDFDVSLRGAVAAQGGLRCATRAAYVGAPTMMERASLFYVWLRGAGGSDKTEMGRCYFSMT
jgi:hypothetical protein